MTKIHSQKGLGALGSHNLRFVLSCDFVWFLLPLRFIMENRSFGDYFSRNTIFYALQLKCYSFFVTPFWGCSTNQPWKGWENSVCFLYGQEQIEVHVPIPSPHHQVVCVEWFGMVAGWVVIFGLENLWPYGPTSGVWPPAPDPPRKKWFFIRP